MAAASLLLLSFLLLPFLLSATEPPEDDANSLLLLKSAFANPSALPSWTESTAPCSSKPIWAGVLCKMDVVIGLRLESLSLSGAIDVDVLSRLKSLRVLSFSNNSFSGPIPPFNKLVALKALFIAGNSFSGQIPDEFFSEMNRLKKLHLENNQFSGPIPSSLTKATALMDLNLASNRFSGDIPSLDLSSLQQLDLSNNELKGSIPATLSSKFKENAFANNSGLCGPPLAECPSPRGGGGSTAGIVTGVLLVVVLLLVVAMVLISRRQGAVDTLGVDNSKMEAGEGKAKLVPAVGLSKTVSVKKVAGGGTGGSTRVHRRSGSSTKGDREKGGGNGDLVVVNEERGVFGLADLMKAAAEVMGTGGLGSAYKAVMGNGTAVAVKRIREMNKLGKETFDVEMRRLGRLRHYNVLPPLAYHYRKEEKLLIFEYISKGSLLYILHGDRGMDHAALDWRTRLKIILGIARGMAYLHAELNSLDIPHGNLKSGNVLLRHDYEPLLVDYGFVPLINPSIASHAMFAYRSPESLSQRRVSPKSDVYCLGIIILEVLTGKFPSQYLNNTNGGTDVIAWTNSAIFDNKVAELIDPAIIITAKASIPEMERLIRIGAACIEPNPDERPDVKEACRRIEELAADVKRAAAAEAAAKDGTKDGSTESHESLVREGFGSMSAKRTASITDRSRSSGDTNSFAIS